MDDETAVRLLLQRAADDLGPQIASPSLDCLVGDGRVERARRMWRRPSRLGLAAGLLAAVIVVAMVALTTVSVRSNGSDERIASPTKAPVTAADLASYQWSTLPPAPIAGRSNAASAWTGTEMLVWGGWSADQKSIYRDGAAYNPTTRQWRTLPKSPLSARGLTSYVWTGKSLFIWGGVRSAAGDVVHDGAIYTPATNSWTMLTSLPDSPTRNSVILWTGSAVWLIYPSSDGSKIRTDEWSPEVNRWARVFTLGVPSGHKSSFLSAVTAGMSVYLWSMWESGSNGTFHAGIDEFRTTSAGWQGVPTNLPNNGVTAPKWTGTQILIPASGIWCGSCSTPYQVGRSGSVLTPESGAVMKLAHGPTDDLGAQFDWTGAALLAFNTGTYTSDSSGETLPGQAAAWDPSLNKWFRLPAAPQYVDAAAAVWTGTSLLQWGMVTDAAKLNGSKPSDARDGGLELAAPPKGSSTGVLQGHFYVVGGPAPGSPRPLSGTIRVNGPGISREVSVGKDGAYSIKLAPGSYTITGHSPGVIANGVEEQCNGEQPFQISASGTATVNTYCDIK